MNDMVSSETNEALLYNLKTSEENKTFIKGITDNYLQMIARNATSFEKANFLNNNIISLYDTKGIISKKNEGLIVFLTVLKHSDYFWNN